MSTAHDLSSLTSMVHLQESLDVAFAGLPKVQPTNFDHRIEPEACQELTDEQRDQQLITDGICKRLEVGSKGLALTADYTPDAKYPYAGEFQITLPAEAEGDVIAIRTLICELTKLISSLPDA